MDLTELSNEELIALSRQGNKEAEFCFFDKNITYAHYVANKYYADNKRIPGHEYEDYFSAAQLGLFKAYQTFDLSKNIKFITYAHMVISNMILRLLRDKRKDLKYQFISFSVPVVQSETKTSYLEDMLSSDLVPFETHLMLEEMFNHFNNNATDLEKEIYRLYTTEEMNQYEISQKLGISQSYTSRLYRKVKNKYFTIS